MKQTPPPLSCVSCAVLYTHVTNPPLSCVCPQEAQVAVEEQKLEEARQAAVVELRRQLAAEMTEALRVQDAEIGLLIARLQVTLPGFLRTQTLVQ